MPHVTCPACSATTYVSLDAANRLIKCPRCSAMFLAPGAVPRRRWGCSSVLLAGLLITASGLWRPFWPTAAGNDRDLAPPGSYHPATVARP